MTAYTKTTWSTGDVITATKINNLEKQYDYAISDHGALSELGDDDHTQYFLASGARKLTGVGIVRSVDNSFLQLEGGMSGWGMCAGIDLFGKDHATTPGMARIVVPDAAGTGAKTTIVITGKTDTPTVSVSGCRIISVGTPTATTDATTKAYVDATAFKSGMVLFWDDAISAIPGGWLFCNGSNGTKDLRGAFIVGADADTGGSYNVGDTGGSATHTLTVDEIPSHLHDIHLISGTNLDSAATYDFTSGAGDSVGDTCYTGGGSAHENRPPFVALPYIRKS